MVQLLVELVCSQFRLTIIVKVTLTKLFLVFQRYFKCSAVFYAGKTVLGRTWKHQGILNRIIPCIGINGEDGDGLANLAVVFLAMYFEEFKVNTLAVDVHKKTRGYREAFTGWTYCCARGYQVLINELGVQTDFCLFCRSPTCGTTTRQSWSGWRKS